MIKFRLWDLNMKKYFPQYLVNELTLNKINDGAFIVEQFTGYKDGDGQDIYVGDIIEREDGRRDYVVFEDGEMTTEVEGWTFSYLIHYREENVKAIGNINENKELLE